MYSAHSLWSRNIWRVRELWDPSNTRCQLHIIGEVLGARRTIVILLAFCPAKTHRRSQSYAPPLNARQSFDLCYQRRRYPVKSNSCHRSDRGAEIQAAKEEASCLIVCYNAAPKNIWTRRGNSLPTGSPEPLRVSARGIVSCPSARSIATMVQACARR